MRRDILLQLLCTVFLAAIHEANGLQCNGWSKSKQIRRVRLKCGWSGNECVHIITHSPQCSCRNPFAVQTRVHTEGSITNSNPNQSLQRTERLGIQWQWSHTNLSITHRSTKSRAFTVTRGAPATALGAVAKFIKEVQEQSGGLQHFCANV